MSSVQFFAAFTILLGFFYSKGHGWARITALVLGIIGTIRDLLYFLLTLLAQSLVQSVTSQMDGAPAGIYKPCCIHSSYIGHYFADCGSGFHASW